MKESFAEESAAFRLNALDVAVPVKRNTPKYNGSLTSSLLKIQRALSPTKSSLAHAAYTKVRRPLRLVTAKPASESLEMWCDMVATVTPTFAASSPTWSGPSVSRRARAVRRDEQAKDLPRLTMSMLIDQASKDPCDLSRWTLQKCRVRRSQFN